MCCEWSYNVIDHVRLFDTPLLFFPPFFISTPFYINIYKLHTHKHTPNWGPNRLTCWMGLCCGNDKAIEWDYTLSRWLLGQWSNWRNLINIFSLPLAFFLLSSQLQSFLYLYAEKDLSDCLPCMDWCHGHPLFEYCSDMYSNYISGHCYMSDVSLFCEPLTGINWSLLWMKWYTPYAAADLCTHLHIRAKQRLIVLVGYKFLNMPYQCNLYNIEQLKNNLCFVHRGLKLSSPSAAIPLTF